MSGKIIHPDEGLVSKHHEFGVLARKRQAQVDRRYDARHSIFDKVENDHYRATCPGCHATNVVMSPVSPAYPSTTPPQKGDAIECDACGILHVVEQVTGFIVKTWGPLTLGPQL